MPTATNQFLINGPYGGPYQVPGGAPTVSSPFQASGGGASGYNSNPVSQPGSYSSTFGGIPGDIGMPNPFQDLSSVYPNLGGTNQQVSNSIYGQLQGNLSPGTLNALQNAAASWGVGSGMPGSPLSLNKGLSNVAGFAENQVNQGIQNYDRTIPAISGTQTVNPMLQAEIAARNAAVNAAPNPTSAATYAQSLFNQYLQQLRGPGGGTQQNATNPAGQAQSGSGALGFGFGSLGQYQDPRTMGGYDPTMGQSDLTGVTDMLFNQDAAGGTYGSADYQDAPDYAQNFGVA